MKEENVNKNISIYCELDRGQEKQTLKSIGEYVFQFWMGKSVYAANISQMLLKAR